MKKLHYPALDETLYRKTLPNGLEVMVLPRPGFSKKLCYFVTDFGAIHTEFSIDGVPYTVPGGVAHYLEHKMFDMPGGRDVSAEFAARGASVNAFTSYDITAYYFSCTQYFEENLKLLLEFVSTPYFTAETVAKEQGIIGQEIGMNEDSPENRVFEDLMRILYPTHPIRVPILGSRESIARITPEILHLCHRAFYRPDNMLLCVVGDVDPEQVAQLAEAALPNAPKETVTRVDVWNVPMMVQTPKTQRSMEVAMPMFQLGFLCEDSGKGEAAIRAEIVGDLAAEALFGESSSLYLQMYEEGLIDASFGGGFETVDGMAMLCLSGDSETPEAVADLVAAQAANLVKSGIREEDFLRMKRSALGRRVRDLDSFNSVAFRLCAYHLSGFDYFDFPKLMEQVTTEELLEFLDRVVKKERMAISIIYPRQEQEDKHESQ